MNRAPRIRPAVESDIRGFYKDGKWTFRAYAAELDGEVLAVGGFYYDGPHVVVFSSVKPGANEKYPFTAGRMVKKIMTLIEDMPCVALADDKFPDAPKLLERLGFEQVRGKAYRWVRKPQRQ